MAVDWRLAGEPRDYIGETLNAFQRGRQMAAQRDAAGALASGDTGRATNAFAAIGDPESVMALQDRQIAQQRQQQQDARLATQDRRQAQQDVYTAQDRGFAAEDRTRLHGREDQATALAAQTRAKANLASLLAAMRRLPEGPARSDLYQSMNGPELFRGVGIAPDHIGQIDPATHFSDAELDAAYEALGGEIPDPQAINLGNGGVALYDKRRGEAGLNVVREPYIEPKYVTTQPGETSTLVNGDVAGPAPSSSPVTTAMLESHVSRVVPGARMTSGGRSGAHNAEVGGKPNSFHLTGQAADFVPPAGMSMDQFAERLRANAPPGVQVIKESDHVHLEPASRRGPPATIQGAPKPDLTPAQQQVQIRSDRTYENSLRSAYMQEPNVKNYADVDAAYRQTRALATKANPSPQDDTALTYSYMKMLDPGSVVREGEFALVARAAGLPDRMVMAFQQLDKGKALTPRIRQEIAAAADTVYAERRKSYEEVTSEYRQRAMDGNVNPDQVIRAGGRSNAATSSATGAAPATNRTIRYDARGNRVR